MIRRAFEAKTDTLATWNLLQKNCLLLQAEQLRSASALSDRLQEARQARDNVEDPEPEAESEKVKKPIYRRLGFLGWSKQENDDVAVDQVAPQPDYLQPVSSPKQKEPTKPLKRLASGGTGTYWLTVDTTKRHIALPDIGPISLGRFDPNVGIPPDVDLSFEDRTTRLISRRHAAVIGHGGKHVVEDLGSQAGVYLNSKKIRSGAPAPLKSGDHIRLGRVRLLYDMVPFKVLNGVKNRWVRHVLLVTPTGRKITITPPRSFIIGRSDRQVNFKPDIDLNLDGPTSQLVSRRHVRLRWVNGQPHIEDLGSSFGTRLKGEVLPFGELVPLKPGDHIWLAGCVLAYDIEF